MSVINNIHDEFATNIQVIEDDTCFQELVLTHIRKNQPDTSLPHLLNELHSLSPDVPLTMQKLNSALLYSAISLRTDPNYIDYTTEILDKKVIQLLGLNMLINKMMDKMLHNYDEDYNLTPL